MTQVTGMELRRLSSLVAVSSTVLDASIKRLGTLIMGNHSIKKQKTYLSLMQKIHMLRVSVY